MKLAILSLLATYGLVQVTAQALSACATACLTQAAEQDGCGSFTNVTCACTNAQFQADVVSCISAECPISDLSDVEGLQTAECGSMTATGIVSNTGVFSATGVSSGTGTSLSLPIGTGTSDTGSGTSAPSTDSGTTAPGGSSTVSPPIESSTTGPAGSTTSPAPTPTSPSTGGSSSTSAAPSTTSSAPSGARKVEIPLGIAFVGLVFGLLA